MGQRGTQLTPERLAPLVAILAALAAIFVVYMNAFPAFVTPQAVEVTNPEPTPTYEPEQPSYTGVADSWMLSGVFTVGDEGLDNQIKEFCDAFAGTQSSYEVAAQTVYNNIVWGSYDTSVETEKPGGAGWVQALARAYFDSANPAEGQTGTGDVYEYAAALSYCLQYFGYNEVYAIPVLSYNGYGEYAGSAVVVVVTADGSKYVCDPALGSVGWMLDLESQDLLVDDIGQDLTDAEALGLTINRAEESTTTQESSETTGEYTTDEYTTDDEYGSDTADETSWDSDDGTDTYGYDTY